LNGEWLEYTVDVLATDSYELNLRVAANGDGKVFHIEMDGTDVTGPIAVPNTGGWQTWQTVTVNNIHLTEGEHVMRIAFDSDYMNLNYVEFTGVVTGGKTKKRNDIAVFPNPFTNEGLRIQTEGAFQYKIMDISGLILESGNAREEKLVGSRIGTGIYFLLIENNDGVSTIKIIRN
jgi:hypothetical protein